MGRLGRASAYPGPAVGVDVVGRDVLEDLEHRGRRGGDSGDGRSRDDDAPDRTRGLSERTTIPGGAVVSASRGISATPTPAATRP